MPPGSREDSIVLPDMTAGFSVSRMACARIPTDVGNFLFAYITIAWTERSIWRSSPETWVMA
jgi:hypothetical protein